MARANVAGKGFAHVSISNSVAERIAAFIETNEWGYRSRAEVVTAAIRRFLEEEGDTLTRGDLERMFKAVALTEPKDVPSFLKAFLAELDMRQPSTPKSASRGVSRTESTKRQ